MNKRFAVVLALVSLLLLGSCSKMTPEKETEEAMVSFKMDGEMAKKVMESEVDHIILDVRTAEEYAEGYIENAVNIPVQDLEARKAELPEDKAMTILVYCRSGNRSAQATDILLEMGYSRVIDFGGIIDWPYEIVK